VIKTVRTEIDTLIFLKQSLKLCTPLSSALIDLHKSNMSASVSQSSTLITTLIENFNESSFGTMMKSIDETITESTSFTRSCHEMRYQECFAVRSGISGLLDVARKSFIQHVEDIYKLAEDYSKNFNISVKVVFSSSRGYYLSIPADVDPLPPVFNQAVSNKKSISCTTLDVASLASRASEAIEQALKITHDLIQSLMTEIRSSMEGLFLLTDSIALIDMLISFADLVSMSPHKFMRPQLTVSGPLFIREGSHPVLATINPQKRNTQFIPNNTLMNHFNSFQIITGPNGSGKTVYIKQTALIIILAQIGCFVPAISASICIRDRILTRLGTSDDIEHNLSTFMTEMKEMAYIINNISEKSLVIIDELGRGTSNIDGLSIAFAVAEHLIDSSSFCLFVTHYSQICALSKMYPNASNIHLKVALDLESPANCIKSVIDSDDKGHQLLRFTHQVASGSSEIKNGYGILMSEICGFPKDMIEDAKIIQTKVRNLFPILVDTNEVDGSIGLIMELLQRLLMLKNSTLSEIVLAQYLDDIRLKTPPTRSKLDLDISPKLSTSDVHSNRFNNNQINSTTNNAFGSTSSVIELTPILDSTNSLKSYYQKDLHSGFKTNLDLLEFE
jgi:DNA mismatch repair protein MSH4